MTAKTTSTRDKDETASLDATARYQTLDKTDQALFDGTAALARALCKAPVALITLVDGKRIAVKAGPKKFKRRIARKGAFCLQTIAAPEGLVIPDCARASDFNPASYAVEGQLPVAYAGVPLIGDDGRSIGALAVLDFKPRRLTAAKLDSLKTLAMLLVRALERRLAEKMADTELTLRLNAEREMRRLATRDPLTGLANRGHFLTLGEKETNRSERHGHAIAAVIFDVDGLRLINQEHGEAVGDQVLMRFAECCDRVFRDEDIKGRLDGQEFAVILPETDIDGAEAAVERLRDAIAAQLIVHDGRRIGFSVTAGVAAGHFAGWNGGQRLMAKANGALFKAKLRAARNAVARKVA